MSETSPPPSEAVIQTAAHLLAAGRAAEAAERLQTLVDEAPTYAAAHVLLASALDATGRQREALEIWRRAAFLVPHSPLVHRERQRLADALATQPPPDAIPVDAWDDETPQPPVDAPDDAVHVPVDELATPEVDTTSDLASSAEAPKPRAAEPHLEETNVLEPEEIAPEPEASEPEDPEYGELEADEPALEREPLEDELLEMPLLPPEGATSPPPTPSFPDLDLEDDGWTILEDDVSSSEPEAPVSTPLLPPEPRPIPTPAAPPEEPEARDPEPAPIEPDPVEATPEPPPAPSEPAPEPDSSIADELDDLIHQLDAAPRIKPDPTFSGPKVTFDETSVDDMASETLAKIYAAQHQYVQAAVVYEKLAAREPDQADTLLERAAEMRDKAR